MNINSDLSDKLYMIFTIIYHLCADYSMTERPIAERTRMRLPQQCVSGRIKLDELYLTVTDNQFTRGQLQ